MNPRGSKVPSPKSKVQNPKPKVWEWEKSYDVRALDSVLFGLELLTLDLGL